MQIVKPHLHALKNRHGTPNFWHLADDFKARHYQFSTCKSNVSPVFKILGVPRLPPEGSLSTGKLGTVPEIRASDRSRKKKSNFAGFWGTNSRKNRPISREFRGSFRGKLHKKAIGKKRPILWLFSRQISLEIDRFCADQTSLFNVFLTEVIICSFNNNTLQK